MADEPAGRELAFLAELEDVIRIRARRRPDESYVASLLAEGDARAAQKLGEEAVEMVLASVSGSRTAQVEEAADLLFHLLVLLQAKGIRLAEVVSALQARHRRRRGARQS